MKSPMIATFILLAFSATGFSQEPLGPVVNVDVNKAMLKFRLNETKSNRGKILILNGIAQEHSAYEAMRKRDPKLPLLSGQHWKARTQSAFREYDNYLKGVVPRVNSDKEIDQGFIYIDAATHALVQTGLLMYPATSPFATTVAPFLTSAFLNLSKEAAKSLATRDGESVTSYMNRVQAQVKYTDRSLAVLVDGMHNDAAFSAGVDDAIKFEFGTALFNATQENIDGHIEFTNHQILKKVQGDTEALKQSYDSINRLLTAIAKEGGTLDQIKQAQGVSVALTAYVASQIANKEAQELRSQVQHAGMKAVDNSYYMLGTLTSLIDEDAGRKVHVGGAAVVQVWSTILEFQASQKAVQALGKLGVEGSNAAMDLTSQLMASGVGGVINLAGGMMKAAEMIFSLISGSKSDLQIILEEITLVKSQISGLRQEMLDQFQKMDLKLDYLLGKLESGLAQLQDDLQLQRDISQSTMEAIQQVRNDVFVWQSIHFSSTMDQLILASDTATAKCVTPSENMTVSTFESCLTEFETRLTSIRNGSFKSTSEAEQADFAVLPAFLKALGNTLKDAWYKIGLAEIVIGSMPEMQQTPFGGRVLLDDSRQVHRIINPVEWRMLAGNLALMLANHPDLLMLHRERIVALIRELDDTRNVMQSSLTEFASVRKLSVTENGESKSIEINGLKNLFYAYKARIRDLEAALHSNIKQFQNRHFAGLDLFKPVVSQSTIAEKAKKAKSSDIALCEAAEIPAGAQPLPQQLSYKLNEKLAALETLNGITGTFSLCVEKITFGLPKYIYHPNKVNETRENAVRGAMRTAYKELNVSVSPSAVPSDAVERLLGDEAAFKKFLTDHKFSEEQLNILRGAEIMVRKERDAVDDNKVVLTDEELDLVEFASAHGGESVKMKFFYEMRPVVAVIRADYKGFKLGDSESKPKTVARFTLQPPVQPGNPYAGYHWVAFGRFEQDNNGPQVGDMKVHGWNVYHYETLDRNFPDPEKGEGDRDKKAVLRPNATIALPPGSSDFVPDPTESRSILARYWNKDSVTILNGLNMADAASEEVHTQMSEAVNHVEAYRTQFARSYESQLASIFVGQPNLTVDPQMEVANASQQLSAVHGLLRILTEASLPVSFGASNTPFSAFFYGITPLLEPHSMVAMNSQDASIRIHPQSGGGNVVGIAQNRAELFEAVLNERLKLQSFHLEQLPMFEETGRMLTSLQSMLSVDSRRESIRDVVTELRATLTKKYAME
jgi:hypothetical protein